MSPMLVFILMLVFSLFLLWAEAVFLAFLIGILAVLYFLFTAGSSAGKAIVAGGGTLKKGLESEWKEVEEAKGQYPQSGGDLVKEVGSQMATALYGEKDEWRIEERPYHSPYTGWKTPPEERPYTPPSKGVGTLHEASDAVERFLNAFKKLFD